MTDVEGNLRRHLCSLIEALGGQATPIEGAVYGGPGIPDLEAALEGGQLWLELKVYLVPQRRTTLRRLRTLTPAQVTFLRQRARLLRGRGAGLLVLEPGAGSGRGEPITRVLHPLADGFRQLVWARGGVDANAYENELTVCALDGYPDLAWVRELFERLGHPEAS